MEYPNYPVHTQLLRVTPATVSGPSGVAQVAGSSILAPQLHAAFTQQLRTDGSLLPRDREPCLAAAVRGSSLSAGFHLGRLAGSHSGLPVYEVVESTVCCGSAQKTADLATTEPLPANTYNNGVDGVGATITMNSVGILTIDGVNTKLGDYIWVKDEADASKNGLYVVTTEGTAGTAAVLTRAPEMSISTQFVGASVYIYGGTTNINTVYYITNTDPPTVGTTDIVYNVVGGAMLSGNFVTSDYSVTSTTMADVTGMSFPVGPGLNYTAEWFLRVDANSDPNGIDLRVTGPASPTGVLIIVIPSTYSPVMMTAFSTTSGSTGAVGGEYFLNVKLALRNGANAGTVQLQAALAMGATTQFIKANSWMEYRTVA